MKKLINNADDVVRQMVGGTVACNPGITTITGSNTVIRADIARVIESGQVVVITGGGAGHEPAHAGYVGAGMLSAAVSGEVFTSPSVDAILAAIRAAASPAGVLLIVKNYTGDRLNFGLAAEIAQTEGIETRLVIVADDVALARSAAHAGRRGIAGTVLVHKVAGAAAAAGLSLDDVTSTASLAADNLASMGVGLGPCVVPAAGSASFELGSDEVEWGLGIHGEPGVERSAAASAHESARRLLDACAADLGLSEGDRVALLVNNLGGTSAMEMSVTTDAALEHLDSLGIIVERLWTGAFLTAMEMQGCSLSLLRVTDAMLSYLDAPAVTSSWPPAHMGRRSSVPSIAAPSEHGDRSPGRGGILAGEGHAVLTAVVERLLTAEDELTEMDQKVGDGDLGISLSRGVMAVQTDLEALPAAPEDVLKRVSEIIRRVVGGTSGPLYAIMLLKASRVLSGVNEPSVGQWAEALREGVIGIEQLGGARPGDRTMIDALHPAVEALSSASHRGTELGQALIEAAHASRVGAEATRGMSPRRGRSSYAGDRVLGEPDPGAWAVALWLEAVSNSVVRSRAQASVDLTSEPSVEPLRR